MSARYFTTVVLITALLLSGCSSDNQESIQSNEDVTAVEEASSKDPLSPDELTFDVGTYLETTSEMGKGSYVNGVNEDYCYIYIITEDGDVFEELIYPDDVYAYALAVDTDGGTSSYGTSHCVTSSAIELSKSALCNTYQSMYGDLLKESKYVKTVATDWIYQYTGIGDLDPNDYSTISTTFYVSSTSGRISRLVNPYATVHFKYADSVIDPPVSKEDMLAVGEPDTVNDMESINQMRLMFAYSIMETGNVEEEYEEKLKDILDVTNAIGR